VPVKQHPAKHYAHHQELKSIIQWLLPVVFGAVVFKLLVWCGAEGYMPVKQHPANHYAHHQELKSIIQWLLPVVLGAVVFKLLVWCGAEGYMPVKYHPAYISLDVSPECR